MFKSPAVPRASLSAFLAFAAFESLLREGKEEMCSDEDEIAYTGRDPPKVADTLELLDAIDRSPRIASVMHEGRS